jgi:dolichol-phosphate mannosyltransferase
MGTSYSDRSDCPRPHVGTALTEDTSATGRVLVVLPAYNEGLCLGRLLKTIQQSMEEANLAFEAIVVDDGSVDQTESVLVECSTLLPLTIIRHEKNLGLGAAIRDGLIEASRQASPSDVIITMDADETHRPQLIQQLVAAVHSGCDVAVASRYQPHARVSGVPVYRRILSFSVSVICRLLFPTRGMRDFTCGFRAYKAPVLSAAIRVYGDRLFETTGFGCMLDILLRMRQMGAIIAEVPADLRYELKTGKSKMPVMATISATFGLILRRRMGR